MSFATSHGVYHTMMIYYGAANWMFNRFYWDNPCHSLLDVPWDISWTIL